MKETIAYLNSLLKDNDCIVIGLSGGPDSMCLLNILMSLNKKIDIICAHVNHNIREESNEEEVFIKKYCSDKNLKVETIKFPKKSLDKNFNEQELREKRYDFFASIIRKYNAKYLLTAHHGDDLIETILMRITRGSNLKGYSGFLTITDKKDYKIVRPLIYMTKNDIEEYLKENDIPFVIDKTNNEDKYTRNRYRHNVLSFLKEENPNVHMKYLKFSKELQSYLQYVDNDVNKEISKRYINNILNIERFTDLDFLIQKKIIEYILDDNYIDNLYLVNEKHISLILDVINNKKPNIEINLPDNLYIKKSYKKLLITRDKTNTDDYEIVFNGDKVELPNGHEIIRLNSTDKKSNNCIKLNSREIKLPLIIRNRREGDKMVIKNMNHSKKIKDIFIDSKVPLEERKTHPVVTDSNNEILWIPGIKKSKFDTTNNENYDIILWYN